MLDSIKGKKETLVLTREMQIRSGVESSESGENTLHIRDLNGAVRFSISGKGLSERQLLKKLIEKHTKVKSLSGNWSDLNLRGLDFTDLNLAAFNFSGSDFSMANLQESQVHGTNFTNCRFFGTNMISMRAGRQTLFCGAQLVQADMYGAKLTAPNFRAATLDRVNAGSANWHSPVFSRAVLKSVRFSRAKLINADWGRALVTKCDLREASITYTLKSAINKNLRADVAPIEGRSLPNKMRGSIFVGNKIDSTTQISKVAKKLVHFDRVVNTLMRNVSTLAICIGLAAADAYSGGLVSDSSWLPDVAKPFVLIGVVDFIKGKFGDPVTDKIKEKVSDWFVDVRQAQLESAGRSYQKIRHVVMVGRKSGVAPFIKALEAVKKKKLNFAPYQLTKYLFERDTAVVVCDQRHLAEALAHISSNRNRGYRIQDTITLVRRDSDHACSGIPSTLTFDKDGTTTLTWDHEGQHAYAAVFDEDGLPIQQFDLQKGEVVPLEEQPLPHVKDLYTSIDAFERKVLSENGLEGFDYDKEREYVVAGKDGTVFVHRSRDRELHNSKGPALIRLGHVDRVPAWTSKHYFLYGRNMEMSEYREKVKAGNRAKSPTVKLTSRPVFSIKRMIDKLLSGESKYKPSEDRPVSVEYGGKFKI